MQGLAEPKPKRGKSTRVCPSWRKLSGLDNAGGRGEGYTGFLSASWRVGLYINTHTHTPISHHPPPPVTQGGAQRLKEPGDGHMLCYQGHEFLLVGKQSSTDEAGQPEDSRSSPRMYL